jgi:hypothetical protein
LPKIGLIAAPELLNVSLVLLATSPTLEITATAIKDAIKAYSIDVAPLWSASNRRILIFARYRLITPWGLKVSATRKPRLNGEQHRIFHRRFGRIPTISSPPHPSKSHSRHNRYDTHLKIVKRLGSLAPARY